LQTRRTTLLSPERFGIHASAHEGPVDSKGANLIDVSVKRQDCIVLIKVFDCARMADLCQCHAKVGSIAPHNGLSPLHAGWHSQRQQLSGQVLVAPVFQ